MPTTSQSRSGSRAEESRHSSGSRSSALRRKP